MTVLTGGSQYVIGKETDNKKLITRHKEVRYDDYDDENNGILL